MPSYRPIQPHPTVEPVESPQSFRKGPKQRNLQACNECRKARIKCDGVRPQCATCTTRQRACTYVGSEGQTRIEAEKNRLELLEKVISSLRSGTTDQVAGLLSGIRSSGDLTSLLSGLTVSSSAEPTTLARPSQSTGSSSRSSSFPSRPETNESPTTAPTTGISPPFISSPWSEVAGVTSSAQQSALGKRRASAENNSVSVLVPSGAYRIKLPNAQDVSRAIRGFFKCSGRLFHVFSESAVMEMYKAVYDCPAEPEEASNAQICCLMSVSAIGAQYEWGNYDLQTEAPFYDIAKYYFDNIVQDAELDSIKVCVMLALYNIMNKATVALAYVEVGLSLSRQYELAIEDRKHSELPSMAFVESKHTWRTLTFLSSWLSSTLGYISGNDIMPYETLPLGMPSDPTDILEVVQVEMTNIAVLKSKILRMHLAFKDLTSLSVSSILTDLQNWYGRMPQQIRLDYEGRDGFTPATKWSIYHVHLLYLGAIILLYRRMSSKMMETYHSASYQDITTTPVGKLYSGHGQQAILAAKGSARILALLLQDCGIFRRCWLVIFQSYTSCLIILHSAMQKVAHGRPAASWQDDLHKANLCLMVLKYCASADGTAQRFLEELQELHDYISAQKTTEIDGNHQTDGLSSADISHVFEEQPMFNQNPGNADSELDPTYLIEIPPTAKPEHIERSHQILTKLCEPFGDSQSEGLSIADVKQRWRDEPTRGLHTLMIARLDWDLESRQPFIWDTKKLSSSNIPSDKIGQEPLSHEPVGKKPRRDLDIPAGRFVGSTAPSGWAPFGDVAGSASGVAGSKETRTKSDVGC